jgi:hypothetical protein
MDLMYLADWIKHQMQLFDTIDIVDKVDIITGEESLCNVRNALEHFLREQDLCVRTTRANTLRVTVTDPDLIPAVWV